jgi:hypothetical protein
MRCLTVDLLETFKTDGLPPKMADTSVVKSRDWYHSGRTFGWWANILVLGRPDSARGCATGLRRQNLRANGWYRLFSVQTLVENAVRYAVGASRQGCGNCDLRGVAGRSAAGAGVR